MIIDVSSPYLTRVANRGLLLIEEIALDMSYASELTFGEHGSARIVESINNPLEAWTADAEGKQLTPADAYVLGQTQAAIVYEFCPGYRNTIQVRFYSDLSEAQEAWATYVRANALIAKMGTSGWF